MKPIIAFDNLFYPLGYMNVWMAVNRVAASACNAKKRSAI
jgi:hypothetical protein